MKRSNRVVAAWSVLPGLMALCLLTNVAWSAETGSSDQPLMVAASSDTMSGEGQWADKGAETCLECHDDPEVMGIMHRKHAVSADGRTPFASRQCETCHGASPQHLEKPAEGEKRKPPTITFGMNAATPVDEQNNVCLGCHEGGIQMHWRGSTHQFAGLSCATCHDTHEVRSPMETSKGQQEACYSCHTDVRLEMSKKSHHPVREGILSCSGCHNPHGSFTQAMLQGVTVNQTCYQCHEEKRGPFLWEHEPVREDCTNCHTPHGSTQVKLLQTRGPWLCERCHSAQYHPSTVYDGDSIENLDHHVVANQCLNCHTKIHGSNHPSGVRFLR